MERILTVQDISCIGRCSLTVALPIISAMGVECAILPTAVLSTHTAFEGFTFRDLSEDLDGIVAHWVKEGFGFGAIYTGYLGSEQQIDIVSRIFDTFEGGYRVVDPVMGDNGALYPGFGKKFPKKMAALCKKADILLPNMTEACLLLGIPYPKEGYSEAFVKDVLVKLAALGPRYTVLTGVDTRLDSLGVTCYDSKYGSFYHYRHERLAQSFHGTGDIFSSAFTGALVTTGKVDQAMRVAADFTVKCIKVTLADDEAKKKAGKPTPTFRYGVDFERAMPYLISRMQEE